MSLRAIFRLRCPKCDKGNMFKNKNPYAIKGFFEMKENCDYCFQDFVIEPGFYYGSMYASYMFNIMLMVGVYLVLYFLGKFTIINFLTTFFIIGLIVMPYIYKISKVMWLYIMVVFKK